MVGELRVELLGGLSITCDSVPVRGFVSTKAQALLCYLAITARPHLRTSLAALFWGDASEAEARKNLRDVLSNLRRLVDPYVEIMRDTVVLAPNAPTWIDVRHFQSLLTNEPAGSPFSQQQAERFWAALALYRGDLLDGFHVRDVTAFDDWLMGVREQLRQQALNALQALASYHAARGEYEQSIAALHRLLQIEPWAEGAYRELMIRLSQHGQRERALQQYEVCRRTLERELGLEPAPETVDLYEQIRTGMLPPKYAARPAVELRNHNLPPESTPLLGRSAELSRIAALLRNPATRLITIGGTGGVGKTSLALAAARACVAQFPDGVWLVDLAPIADAGAVPTAIARALNVGEADQRPLVERLLTYLQDRELLLMLDNLEHLPDATPIVARLLAAAPRVRILATSRAFLRLRDECELILAPLALPVASGAAGVDLPSAMASPAVALFVERAQAALPDFRLTTSNAPAVAEICVQVDGLPLAIELAAARVRLLTVDGLRERVTGPAGRRLPLLAGGARDLPLRQQTLRATLDWSYQLLPAGEQRLFHWMAVFAGGCAFDAAEAVCSPLAASIDVLEGIASLLDKSLLRQVAPAAQLGSQVPAIEPRFAMFETIREYALEHLDGSGESELLRVRHAEYYAGLAEEAEPWLSGGAQQGAWLRRLTAEYDNLRAAFAWAAQRAVPIALRLGIALRRYWLIRGPISEGRRWLATALALAQDLPDLRWLRAQALAAAGNLALRQADWQQALVIFAESHALFEAVGDAAGAGWSFLGFGRAERQRGQSEQAHTYFMAGRARFIAIDALHGIFHSYQDLSSLALNTGDYDRAIELLQELLTLCYARHDPPHTAKTLYMLGSRLRDHGEYDRAAALLAESIVLFRSEGDLEGLATSLHGLAETALLKGEYQRVLVLGQESQTYFDELGYRMFQALVLHNLGCAALRLGDSRRAAELHRSELELFRHLGLTWGLQLGLIGLGGVAAAQGAARRAARIFGSVIEQTPGIPAHRHEYEHSLALVRAQLDEQALRSVWATGKVMSLEQAIAYALGDGAL